MNHLVRYTKEHVWVRYLEQDQVQIGITAFAKQQLGEIICVEWPLVGGHVKKNESIGTLESAKTVVDLYSPVDARIVQNNPDAIQDLHNINDYPVNKGWIALLHVENREQMDSLLTEEEYQTWINKGE